MHKIGSVASIYVVGLKGILLVLRIGTRYFVSVFWESCVFKNGKIFENSYAQYSKELKNCINILVDVVQPSKRTEGTESYAFSAPTNCLCALESSILFCYSFYM